MESNSNDNYVLVLEDRTEVKNEKEAGKLSVVSGIDDKGNLKTTEAIAANQAAFLKPMFKLEVQFVKSVNCTFK